MFHVHKKIVNIDTMARRIGKQFAQHVVRS